LFSLIALDPRIGGFRPHPCGNDNNETIISRFS